MSARASILKAIAENKPAFVELIKVDAAQVIQYDDLTLQFMTVLKSIGGTAIELLRPEVLQAQIEERRAAGYSVINRIEALGVVDDNLSELNAESLEMVDFAYVKGAVSVAENGAIWVGEAAMGNRLLPFICQHLILFIERSAMVATLHQAYAKLDTAKEGFGVFIAGPSKTADIEQSLVIGAHGARSLVVYIIG